METPELPVEALMQSLVIRYVPGYYEIVDTNGVIVSSTDINQIGKNVDMDERFHPSMQTANVTRTLYPESEYGWDLLRVARDIANSLMLDPNVQRWVISDLMSGSKDLGIGVYCIDANPAPGLPALGVLNLIADASNATSKFFDAALRFDKLAKTVAIESFADAVSEFQAEYHEAYAADTTNGLQIPTFSEATSVPRRPLVDAFKQVNPGHNWVIAYYKVDSDQLNVEYIDNQPKDFIRFHYVEHGLADEIRNSPSCVCLRFNEDRSNVAVIDAETALCEIKDWCSDAR